jgi:gluconolactonase
MLGITLDGNGNVYACDSERKEILRCSPEGKIDIYATGTTQRPFVNPNYSVFDSQGRLFFTDSGDYYKPSGSIWVVEPGKAAEPLTEPNLPFANGLSLDSENQFLYVVLSTSSSIGRFKLDGKDLVGQMEIVVELEKGTVPDGIALDSSRNIWLGCYALDEIWKIKPNGQIEKVMEDKTGELLNRPTNIALQKDKIFFANLGGWHIGSFEAKVEPLALNYPELL